MMTWISRLFVTFMIQHGLTSLAATRPDFYETFCLGVLAWCVTVSYEKAWGSK